MTKRHIAFTLITLSICINAPSQETTQAESCALPDEPAVSALIEQSLLAGAIVLPGELLSELLASPAWAVECSKEESANRDALLESVRSLEGDEKKIGVHILRRMPYTYTEIFTDLKEDEFGDHKFRMCPDHLLMDSETFLAHVRLSLEARKSLPWCADLSEEDFLCYVAAHRGTLERLEDWRSFFWNEPELHARVMEYADEYRAASSPEARSAVFARLVHELNAKYLAVKAKYAPRGMPDLTPSELFESGTGRCTDLTNALLAIYRTYGIGSAGVRTIWWGRQASNHYWAAALDPASGEWYDIDGGLGGELSKGYLSVGRHGAEFHTKVYWVDMGAVQGDVRKAVRDESHPWSIRHYLYGLPMLDKTERYTPVGTVEQETELPEDTSVYLCCWNGGRWREVAVTRVTADGKVRFENVGCRMGILYVLMHTTKKGRQVPLGRPGTLTANPWGSEWNPL